MSKTKVAVLILVVVMMVLATIGGFSIYFSRDEVKVNLTSVGIVQSPNPVLLFRINDRDISELSYIKVWFSVRISVIIKGKKVDEFDIKSLLEDKDYITYGGQDLIEIRHSNGSSRYISLNS